MAGIAQDKQVIREALVQSTANAEDKQVIREALIAYTAHAHDLQVVREVLMTVPVATKNRPVLFGVT